MKMIRFVLFIVAFVFFAFALFKYFNKPQAASEKGLGNEQLTEIKVSKPILDVGKHKINVPVLANFVVYNEGRNALYIQKVEPDCHCTVADYSKLPISPGDSSVILLKYDGKAPGAFQSSATLTLNANPSTVLILFRGVMVE
ncbi:DUF1573 domain-containing protein [Paraflavitalea soli]|uniref:DUF1573 domain-containing protein n=1 Tax=Paraflavitalea soli TaxID=2315862 RepID=A0A3B7MI38_9BACT|nr:DUF1573 domain-containing protein [Paraflavitalea soli]AXY73247.1 DUF1573 domain-containing protein [Paraflavitalea soli]